MSSKDNPCRKFQANIFNKSKCQNCFKPRESHLLTDEDLNQVAGGRPGRSLQVSVPTSPASGPQAKARSQHEGFTPTLFPTVPPCSHIIKQLRPALQWLCTASVARVQVPERLQEDCRANLHFSGRVRIANLEPQKLSGSAKPIYGGWLLLAPEGTNFDNPLHRSRIMLWWYIPKRRKNVGEEKEKSQFSQPH
ncbi:Myosin phosphatase Rho-interacting protein [Liparis tanakae]|uniref:Myosin phosphatase Rho-interacting protein n=1 Tax=Liparis tanakae TaxID=230148 RepID=A0A4Z2FC29_9TELE|nr:Myosin phosphatase Rho-interacting protein [Liparis tanakae]